MTGARWIFQWRGRRTQKEIKSSTHMCVYTSLPTQKWLMMKVINRTCQQSNGNGLYFTRNKRNAKLTFVIWNIDQMHFLTEMLPCWPTCEDWCCLIVEANGDVGSLQTHLASDLSNSTSESSSHEAPLWLLRQIASPPPRLSAPFGSTPGRMPRRLCTLSLSLLNLGLCFPVSSCRQ